MSSKVLVESWRPLYDLVSHEISNYGRIRSINRKIFVERNNVCYYADIKGKYITARCTKKEPYLFCLINGIDGEGQSKRKTVYLHRAVADHFARKTKKIKDYEAEGGRIHATHIVKDYNNNCVTNVKFITHSELISSQPGGEGRVHRAWLTRRHRYGQSGFKKTKEKK